jgi:hypothetical protein
MEMNENVKMIVPIGAAAIGGYLGNWLYAKKPMGGKVGKFAAIGLGIVGAYYISKYAMGEKIEMPFSNAVNLPMGTTSIGRKDCDKLCFPYGGDVVNGRCMCYRTSLTSFNNAVKDGEGKLSAEDKRKCRLHRQNRLNCGYGLVWDEATCSCKPV